ncbi:MAG: helix-turn-helix domain-containing protein [Clostridia bacterium]|nr:helix-turn-helix domain-containing protein [Clostridia bacterium]
MSIGSKIAALRRRERMTQEQLAEKLDVSFQAVSAWERDEYLPETKKLVVLARTLNTSLDALIDETEHPWELRDPNFDPEHQYTFLKARAQSLGLTQTLAALPLMREKHDGQTRNGMVARVPYRVHPLTLACHALAMGIGEDDVLAALLLHDVVEDTDTKPEELPVNERVREAVKLVSYNTYYPPENPHPSDDEEKAIKQRIKPEYYANIKKNPLAALIKCIDRCNNLSCMADGFTREKQATYVVETECYILPLLDVIKAVPEWNNAAWLLRYSIISLLETFKRVL